MAKRIMRAFKLNEISAVDRPAQAHARAVLMKRADAPDLSRFLAPGVAKDLNGVANFAGVLQSIAYLARSAEWESEEEGDASPVPNALRNWLRDGTTVFRAMADEEIRELVTAVVGKRNFDAKERRADAKSGAAMPDGSFPIEDADDLANAMRLAGHAKDPAAARRHIKARAKALGLESHLSAAYAKAVIDEAHAALRKALAAGDKPERAAAIKDYFDYLEGVLPAEIVKVHRTAPTTEKEWHMPNEADDLKVKLAKALEELAVLKLSPKHKDYMDAANMNAEERKAFAEKDPDERDAHIAAHPVKKAELPADIVKALAQAEEDRKVLKALQEKDEVATFGKRAVSLGLVEAHGEILRKARAGDGAAWGELETLIKGLVAQRDASSALTRELGGIGKAAPGSVREAMQAKANEHREAMEKIGKRTSPQQAFTKVYLDPANVALKAAYDREEAARRAALAA